MESSPDHIPPALPYLPEIVFRGEWRRQPGRWEVGGSLVHRFNRHVGKVDIPAKRATVDDA